MEFKTFYYEFLSKKPLYVIRELGRVIGVKAPASKNKDTVIKEIISIQKRELAPETKQNKGAPPKFKIDLSEFLVCDENSFFKPLPKIDPNNVDPKAFEDYEFKIEDDENDNFGNVCRDINHGTKIIEGYLDIINNTFGFIRVNKFEPSKEDGYISELNIKKYNLRNGDQLKVRVYINENQENCPATKEVVEVNGLPPRTFIMHENFEELTPEFPNERFDFSKSDKPDLRLIDLFCPIGKGQRGLIVAPPKTGKTTIIKNVAKEIEKNYPEVMLMVLLIDERPEEVTDIKKSISSEVYYSTFDENASHHVKIAEFVLNRAKRFVEIGKDVVILLDSITRLTRAYNATVENSGKTLSGGLEAQALIAPKKFFGSARNFQNEGSLTILATALVDTGSRLDEVIFEEFKGTGNMEIKLSKELSERRVFPAIDLFKSGTRRDDYLLSDEELILASKLRNILSNNPKATELVLDIINKTKDINEFIQKAKAFIKIYEKQD